MLPGVAPYVRLSSAADLRFADQTPVTSAAAYLGWHRGHLYAAGAVAQEWPLSSPVLARVNHGRWIADCPNCRCGPLTHPEWRLACCGECGCVMTNVVFPADLDQIVDLLLRRPTRPTQNWAPPETVADLARENAANGVTV
jgi:hypothetical protein